MFSVAHMLIELSPVIYSSHQSSKWEKISAAMACLLYTSDAADE